MRFEETTIEKYNNFIKKERLNNVAKLDSLREENLKEINKKENTLILFIVVMSVFVCMFCLVYFFDMGFIAFMLFLSLLIGGALKGLSNHQNVEDTDEEDKQNRLKKAKFKIQHNLFLYEKELLDENLLEKLLSYSKRDIQWVFDVFNKKYYMNEKSFERTILTYVVKLEENNYEIRELNIQNIKKYSVDYLAKQIVKEIKMSSSDENILKES